MEKGSILIVDDNKNVLSALRLLLEPVFDRVRVLNSPKTLLETVREEAPDMVLLDMNFSAGVNSGNEGLFWLSEIRKADTDLPVVLFTAYGEIDLAVEALKRGATDFVVKPWDNAKLLATLHSALSLRLSRKEVQKLKEKQTFLNEELSKEEEICWGRSDIMQELLVLIGKVAKTDANVLITGENGTGKELIARRIHHLSGRASESLVTVDMGAITETLFESELFGHVKGSFTDARTDRVGKFEAADKGTLFLDEIGNLSYPLQAKLLTALQSHRIVRVGSNIVLPVDIRLIAATNRNLFHAVKAGEFREDLLYRLNTIQIEVPPLRKRGEDIPDLVSFFLRKFGEKYHKKGLSVEDRVFKKLALHTWPGNIRELQHTVEKAVILSDTSRLRVEDFSLQALSDYSEEAPALLSLEEMERWLVERAVQRHGHNLSAAASELGVSRPTLYGKMKKYGLD